MNSLDNLYFRSDEDDMEEMTSSQKATYQMMNDIFPKENGVGSFMEAVTRYWVGFVSSKNNIKTTERGKRLVYNIRKKLREEPFVRAKDRASFIIGVSILMLTQFVLTAHPEKTYLLYTILAIPLFIWRFMSYHKNKWHYFMLDFCYACNLKTMLLLYVFPHNTQFFKVVYCLSNGPLITAVVAWSNSLVFHDVDRITSLFIHMYPPILTFAMRWYSDIPEDSSISWKEGVFIPIIFYIWWQVVYILKTEVIDKKKLKEDEKIVTSARYLATVRPHPVYLLFKKNGVDIHPNILLPLFQLFYTFATLIPTLFLYRYKYLNLFSILFVLGWACWNGAAYYFEVFGYKFTKRLERIAKAQSEENKEGDKEEKKPEEHAGFLPSSLKSVTLFVAYFTFAYGSLLTLIYYFC